MGSGLPAELRDALRGLAADIGAGDGEDLGAVDGAHDLAAAGGDAGAEKQAIELDAFVTQRIALVDADDRRHEALDVGLGREAGPRMGVLLLERLDAVRCQRFVEQPADRSKAGGLTPRNHKGSR